MNLKKVIIISIILIILIIITGISLIIILNINENNINNTIEDPAILDISSKFENVIDYSNYSTISTLINAYFSNIALKDSEVVYNLLSQDYIAENNITPDNIFSTIKTQVSNSPICLIDNMYMSNDYNYPAYLAKGKVLDIKYQENDGNRMLIEQKIENINSLDYYILVKLDNVDMTYSIQELDEAEFNEIFNSPENVEKNAINKNSNNELVYSTVNDETICTNLLSDYKLRTEANIENAFSKVDEEYKNKKYTSINEYEEYINKNENVYGFMKLSKYQKEVMDDYTQYICLDRAGHYYIFRETSPMQYTVILDTYTIDLPEFVEQYNSSSEDKKVQFNIQKFFDAINDGDYSYAYSKLDQTYKNNNFPTQTDFENYMKTNFYAQNKLGYTSYEKNGDLYIYKMVITNGENSSQTIEKQFVVKLLDGTNFVMSFEK